MAIDTERIQRAVSELLLAIGEDVTREGLRDTPKRVADMYLEIAGGTDAEAVEVLGTQFEEDHQEMVIVRDVPFYSICEHHLLPFFGKVHIAYIPDGHIVGLSKMARLVEVFARRLQVQERLTDEVAQSIWDVVAPQGVGVVIEACHLCMMMRGVQKQNSFTITSAMRGSFLSDARTRDEFLRLCQSRNSPLSS